MKNTFLILFYFAFSAFVLSQETTKIFSLKKELLLNLSDTTRVQTNLKLGNLYATNFNDSSFYYYEKGLDLAVKNNYKLQQAKILFNIGLGFERKSDFKKAIENYNKSLLVYNDINLKQDVALIYNMIGYNYISLYAEDKAIEYYLKSLTLYREISSDENGIASNLIDIGNLYYSQENYILAKEKFKEALKIYEKLEDTSGILVCYIGLGNAIADEGKNEMGLNYFFKSIELAKEIKDDLSIATSYNNIGDIYIYLKQYDKAASYFDKALSMANKLNDRELEEIVYLNLADLNIKKNNFRGAILNANKSIAISKKIGDLEVEADNLSFLVTANEGLGNKLTAFKYLKEYTEIKNKLISLDKTKKVQLFNVLHELETSNLVINDLSNKNGIAELKYKNEKKFTYFLVITMMIFGFFIILLILQHTSKKKAYKLLEFKNHQINKMNVEIESQRDYLKQLNSTKDKFFSIIAHDLNNPFNSINGFTELMIDNNNEYDQEKRLKFLKIIKGATTTASNLLNNLLVWANSQSGNLEFNPKEVELIKEVSDAISLLEIQAINKDIIILNNVPKNLFVNTDKNMLATIFRNLMSNAIKFSNTTGEIHISVNIISNFIEISVKDNGVGMSQSDVENLFSIGIKNSNIGTANEQGSGLGLVLCKDFVEKHGGKLWVESAINEGSEFKFTLPLAV